MTEEYAVLVGVDLPESKHNAVESLAELQQLAESAGAVVRGTLLQKRAQIDPKYFIGRGKVQELAELVVREDADVVIFDDDLSPAQLREVEKVCECKVIDRSELILDIFAGRARTHEERVNVEVEQRLRGMWTHLERIAGAGGGTGVGSVGGIGTRGPGERQIEIDRRIVNRRVTALKREIASIDKRKVRQVRSRHEFFNISLVGYTNAGKSTLMNTLTGAGVKAEDRLFATLDTKTRKWNLGGGDEALLSDTVGFVRRLPHHLVASFRATLEEAIHADLLLHVVDASSPTAWEQYEAVCGVLDELGCKGHQAQIVLNKIDVAEDPAAVRVLQYKLPGSLPISAKTGEGLVPLIASVRERIAGEQTKATVRLPVQDGKAIAYLEKHADVRDRRYMDHSVEMDVVIGRAILARLQASFPGSSVQLCA